MVLKWLFDDGRPADWADFALAAREEAADRNGKLIVVSVFLVLAFTAFDFLLDPIGGVVLRTRFWNNAGVLLVLAAVGVSLRVAWTRRHVFGLLFLLCLLVLSGQAYSLGHVSPAPGRLAFHYVSALGLTIIAIQWPWPWQLGLGLVATVLFMGSVSPQHPDYGFFAVALACWGIVTAVVARIFVRWRYQQLATDARLRRANEVTATQAAQLAAKNAELTDFFSVLSHDLRAPLINLEGFARELEGAIASVDRYMAEADAGGNARRSWPNLRQEIAEALGFIRRSVDKMSLLVSAILDLSRIETRPQMVEKIELDTVVQEIVDSFHYQLQERGIDVQTDPLPVVVADAVRLNQVFSNLIDNAIKYMKPEGDARIHIGARQGGVENVFYVRDNGIGIEPQDQREVFRLFTRIHANVSPGEGVGLAAVKKIIERHGGRIWVESEPGGGTTFWFTLPRRPDANAQQQAA